MISKYKSDSSGYPVAAGFFAFDSFKLAQTLKFESQITQKNI